MNITLDTFKFLKDLKNNNNREWFLKNKMHYQTAKQEVTKFAEAWFKEIAVFDESLRSPEEGPYVFRIYRDARFAKGKPYKTNIAILIVKGGKPAMATRAGYYLHIEPGKCFLAGGCYLPPSTWLHNIRKDIARNAKEFKSVINSEHFKSHLKFGGEKLKMTPQGFDKFHPEIELLKHKTFMATCQFSDYEVVSEDFLKKLVEVSKALKPFDDYLNQQLP